MLAMFSNVNLQHDFVEPNKYTVVEHVYTWARPKISHELEYSMVVQSRKVGPFLGAAPPHMEAFTRTYAVSAFAGKMVSREICMEISVGPYLRAQFLLRIVFTCSLFIQTGLFLSLFFLYQMRSNAYKRGISILVTTD